MPEGIEVYDDLLPAHLHAWVEQQISDPNFPWYWHSNTYGMSVSAEPDARVFESDQFGHIFYQADPGVNSDWFGVVKTVLQPIGQRRGCDFDLMRAKANLLMPSVAQGDFNTPHRDFATPHWVIIYYVIDSDGDTVFFDNDRAPWNESCRVSPRANRAVMFDGSIYHASRHPRAHSRRMVLNFNVQEVGRHTLT